jgi:hypothetical protein
MLIIQHFAHDYFSHKLDENYIGLSFKIKGKFDGTIDLFPTDQPNIIIQDGFICIKKLDLSVIGKNDTSSFSKNLDIKFNEVKKISFERSDNKDDFLINVPKGSYEKLCFGIQLNALPGQPPVFIQASYYNQSAELIPMQIEVSEIEPRFELMRESPDLYTDEDSPNPSFFFEINVSKWLQSISHKDLEKAELTDNTILIDQKNNTLLYQKIKEAIMAKNEIRLEMG